MDGGLSHDGDFNEVSGGARPARSATWNVNLSRRSFRTHSGNMFARDSLSAMADVIQHDLKGSACLTSGPKAEPLFALVGEVYQTGCRIHDVQAKISSSILKLLFKTPYR